MTTTAGMQDSSRAPVIDGFRPIGLIVAVLISNVLCSQVRGDERRQPAPAATHGQITTAPETLKERLSDKASDEQRVNNCKVPLVRRGPAPRPDGCEPTFQRLELDR
jgi:hypothetical protein